MCHHTVNIVTFPRGGVCRRKKPTDQPTKDVAPSVAWRREAYRTEKAAVDDPPLKDETGPFIIYCPSSDQHRNCFKKAKLGKLVRDGVERIWVFWALRYHLELNWTNFSLRESRPVERVIITLLSLMYSVAQDSMQSLKQSKGDKQAFTVTINQFFPWNRDCQTYSPPKNHTHSPTKHRGKLFRETHGMQTFFEKDDDVTRIYFCPLLGEYK